METFVDTNNDCSFHKIDDASTSLYNLNRQTKIDRYWPIDPPNRHNRKIYHYRTRNNHRQKIYHQQLFRRQYDRRFQMISTSNSLRIL